MRFSAIINDSGNIEVFSKIVQIVSKLCKKKCVIRLTPNEFCFVNAYNVREGRSLDMRIIQSEIFSSYIFDGISPEHNCIIFELPMEDFVHSTSAKENTIKIKLSQKNNSPHLVIELKTICITHEIPIQFVLVRNWHDYEMPNVGIPSVVITLPTVKIMHKLINSLKNIGVKVVTLRANNAGELALSGNVDLAKSEFYVQNLPVLENDDENLENVTSIEEFFSVQLDLNLLYPVIGNLHNYFNKIVLKIVNKKAAIFCAKQSDCQFTLCLSGLNNI